MTAKPQSKTETTAPEAVPEKLLAALKNLRFGSVEITVHEGRIVQIERREKLRLNLPL
jgi:hypothetical protein